MDISGPATPRRLHRNDRRLRRAAILLAAVLLGGCATSFHSGAPPPIDRLTALTPGVSTAADAAAALGPPQGHGAGLMTGIPLQDVLVYQDVESDGARSRMRMLLVFVDGRTSTYGGYMWFRSGQIITAPR